jgi:hypothetical protein
MNSPKRLRSLPRLIAALVILGWVTLSPPPAMAFGSCDEFWNEAYFYCQDIGLQLCGGYCFEYVNCPIGCDQFDNWCCDDGCCETQTYGAIRCCYGLGW